MNKFYAICENAIAIIFFGCWMFAAITMLIGD